MFEVNQQVGGYTLIKEVGEGAFSTVFLAKSNKTGQKVALKIIEQELIQDNDMEEQLQREISIMYQMDHPGLVKLHEVMKTPTHVILVLEFAEGGELFNKLVTGGKLDHRTARSYFQQLIDAISFMHSKKTAHRDLKPENLLLDNEGHLKIADFGLSIMSLSTSAVLKTRCGTPNYVAPEILSSAEGYKGSEADVWAAGCILYVMLNAALPFDADSLPELARKILSANVYYYPDMGSDTIDLIKHILVVDPKKRYKISEIKDHPWFKVNYKPIMPNNDGKPRIFNPLNVTQLNANGELLKASPPDADSDEETINAFELVGKLASVSLDTGRSDHSSTIFSCNKSIAAIDQIIKKISSDLHAGMFKSPSGLYKINLLLSSLTTVHISVSNLAGDSQLIEITRIKGQFLDFSRLFNVFKDALVK